MRSGSKRLMIGLGSFVIAVAMTAPSFAAKKAVTDEELDMVTAAGQPAILQGSGGTTVSFVPTVEIAMTIQTGSQTNLRALALNNVAGENQVANGINISGSNSSSAAQTNNITQSWGATVDRTIVSVPGVTASASVSCGSALICKGSNSVATAAGVARRLSITGDHIIDVGAGSTVTYNPQTAIAMSIDGGGQTGLVALVINNVAGLNQVGNGVNLAAGGVTLGSSTLTTTVGVGAGLAGQSNTLGAWRGTPSNFTRVP